MRLHYRDPRGTHAEIVAGRRLGGGAEGDVFACLMPNGAETDMCVKLCSEDRRYGLRERLDPMMQIYTAAWFVPGENHLEVTWPVAVAEDDEGDAVGFFMNVVSPRRYLSASDLFAPHRDHRTRSWGTLLSVAADLARVVAKLHASGIVIGDLALQNIWVSAASSRVTLLDCDSFTFPDMPPALTYRADYTPPEGGSELATVATDEFALAVAICLLLAEQTHPFAGVDLELGDDDDRTRSANIAHGRTWLFHDNIRVPQAAPPATFLPPEVRAMASQAFEVGLFDAGKRPSAEMWHRTLLGLVSRLSRCPANQRHVFDSEQPYCPWCLRTQQRHGRDPFPGDPPTGNGALGLVPAWMNHACDLLRLQEKNAQRERLAKEKAERERLAKEKAERERLAKEKAERERLAKEAQRLEDERLEEERAARQLEEQQAEAKRREEEWQEERLAAERARVQRVQAVLGTVVHGRAPAWAVEGKSSFLARLIEELLAHPTGFELLAEGIDTKTLGPWLGKHVKKVAREPTLTSLLTDVVAAIPACQVLPQPGGPHYVLTLDPSRASPPSGSFGLAEVRQALGAAPGPSARGAVPTTSPAPTSEPTHATPVPDASPVAVRLDPTLVKELDVTPYELKQRLVRLRIAKRKPDDGSHEVIDAADADRVRADVRADPPRPSLHDQRCAFWAVTEMDWLSERDRSRVHQMLGLGSVHDPGRKTGRLTSDDDADSMVATLLGDPGHPRGGHSTMTVSARTGVNAAKQVRDLWVWDGPTAGHVVADSRPQMTSARANVIEAVARAVSGDARRTG